MLVKINWNPNRKQLLNFGLFMLIAMPILGALLAWKIRSLAPIYWFAAIGVAIEAICIFLPSLGIWLYKAWMGLGFCMGLVMAPIALGIAYYGIFTPMGFLLRLFGRDALQKRKPQTDSFWRAVHHRTEKASYERQF